MRSTSRRVIPRLAYGSVIFISVALVRGQAPSPAPTESTPAVRVDKIDIVEKGLYRVELKQQVEDENVLSGHRYVHSKGELIKATTTVPAVSGVQFGLRYLVTGEPNGAKVPVRIVARYPDPGRQNPKTGMVAQQDEFPQTSTVGGPPGFFFMYIKWGLVPGVWTFEIWCQDKKLAEQKFTMAP